MNSDAFAEKVASKLGLQEGQYLSYTPGDAWQLRNRIWQGQARSHRFPVAFVFLSSDEDRKTAVSNSLERLKAPPGGFEAVAMVERRADGRWFVSKVIEEEGGTVGVRLKALEPDLEIVLAAPATEKRAEVQIGPSTEKVAQRIAHQLEGSPNLVLQGPPGTGKTFLALRAAEKLANAPDVSLFQLSSLLLKANDLRALIKEKWFADLPLVWDVVQMHPGYTYDDFVRGRTLAADENGSRFESVDRTMVQFCAVAKARGSRPTLLILEEMNRCSLATVLGDLIFAIDPSHRGDSVHLQTPPPADGGLGIDTLLAIPPSLKLLGTMNTADRSIALVDFAVRRRFQFIDVLPDEGVIEEYYAKQPERGLRARSLFKTVFELVPEERLRLGHSYFLCKPGEMWARELANRIAYEVLPMLREYLAEGRSLSSSALGLAGHGKIDLESDPPDLSDTSSRDLIQKYLEA